MPLGELVRKIFSADTQLSAEAVVQASFIKALEDKDQEEREDAQRLIDWYNRDRKNIKLHLKAQAAKTFDSTDDWQFPVVNGVRRTIRRLSTAYQQPPIRELLRAGKELKATSEVAKKVAKMFSKIDINRKFRSLDRWATLLNTVHAEVVWRRGFIDWDIRLRPDVTVVTDPEDFLEFVKFAYQWTPIDPETLKPVAGWVYWDDERHVFISKGGIQLGLSNTAGTNPYKDPETEQPVIPIATVRKDEDIPDYWGRFGADLVDAFQIMNVQLGNIWETTSLQVHGQPLFINIDVESGKKVLLGPRHPLVATKVTKDDVAPNVLFPKPDPDIEEVQGLLDWFIKTNAAAYGLPPSAWALDEQRLSGFAKFMDNIELLEIRQEDGTQWERTEQELFRLSIIVWNQWAEEADKVPTDLELRVTFPEAKVPETPTEKSTRWAIEIGAGLASAVDFFMEEEGLNAENALMRAIEVATQNKKIRKAGAEPIAALPPEPSEGGEG